MKTAKNMIVALVTLLALGTTAAQAEISTYYVITDHLGTPRVLTDETQAVVWRSEATPFGDQEVQSEMQSLRFPGQYADPESGYSYNYFRDYDPSLGRYIQSDPIGLAGGLNTFGYAYQSPTKYIDPTGEAAVFIPFIPPAAGAIAEGCAIVGAAAWAGYEGLKAWSAWNEAEPENPPDIPEDPAQPPGEGWEWRGSGERGSREGAWYNPETGESLHDDRTHPAGKDPHVTYTDKNRRRWDNFLDGNGWKPQ